MQYFPMQTKVSRPQGGFVPGQLFSAKGQFGNCLRISYARLWDAEVEEGLRTLGALVKAHSRAKPSC